MTEKSRLMAFLEWNAIFRRLAQAHFGTRESRLGLSATLLSTSTMAAPLSPPMVTRTQHRALKRKRRFIGAMRRFCQREPQDDLVGRLARQGIALDQTGISRIENETRYVMDYEAVAIARALRGSVAWLMGEQQ